jgi:hypothetical protein
VEGLQSAVIDGERTAGSFLEPQTDLEAMQRLPRNGSQDEHVERTAEDRQLIVFHRRLPL